MIRWWDRLLCWLGVHDWEPTWPPGHRCRHCGDWWE